MNLYASEKTMLYEHNNLKESLLKQLMQLSREIIMSRGNEYDKNRYEMLETEIYNVLRIHDFHIEKQLFEKDDMQ